MYSTNMHVCVFPSYYYVGRYDVNDSFITCDGCGECFSIQFPHNIIRENFWPGTPSHHCSYMFDQDMFILYDLLQKNMPGTSEVGFVKALEQFSALKGRVSLFYECHRNSRQCIVIIR